MMVLMYTTLALQDAVKHGLTNSSTIEAAFRRLMRMRIRLGMNRKPQLLNFQSTNRKTVSIVVAILGTLL